MKKLFFLAIIISLYIKSTAQQLNWVKEDSLNDAGFHFGNCVSTDANNNVYTSTIYKKTTSSQTEWGSYVSKRNSQGELIWRRFILHTEIWGIVTDQDGNTYLSGNFMYHADFGCGAMSDTLDDPSYIRTFSLVKLDSNGLCIWSKMVKHSTTGSKIAIDKSGNNIYVIGWYSTPSQFGNIILTGTSGQFLAKYTKDGDCLWVNRVLNYNHMNNLAVNDNYVAITGGFWDSAYFGPDSSSFSLSVTNPSHIYNVYTALYDLNGNFKWARETVRADYGGESNSVALDQNNNVYVTGGFYNNASIGGRNFSVMKSQDIFLVKYNERGDTVLTTTWPGINSEEGRAIYATENGIYFSGRCNQQLTIADTTIHPGTASIVLAKLNFDLTHTEWVITFSSPGGAHSEILQITSDSKNNIIVSGDYTTSLQVDTVLLSYNNWAYKKPFVMSLSDVHSNVVSVKENTLEQNSLLVYPNPSSDAFVFEYKSSVKEKLTLIIYNGLGKVVFRKEYPAFAGDLKDSFDLSGVANGIYLLEISSGDNKETRKLNVSH